MTISRRKFIELATAFGASLALASRKARALVLDNQCAPQAETNKS
jgi:hypothetical protein